MIPCTALCTDGRIEIAEGIGTNGPCTHFETCRHCDGTGNEPCRDCGARPAVVLEDRRPVCGGCAAAG